MKHKHQHKKAKTLNRITGSDMNVFFQAGEPITTELARELKLSPRNAEDLREMGFKYNRERHSLISPVRSLDEI